MTDGFEVLDLIGNGEVLSDVAGTTFEEVYENVCGKIDIPVGLTAEDLKRELCEREKILSTAVGNSIAVPHPRRPLLTRLQDCRIVVCYLHSPLNMNAPDSKHVQTMFFLLTDSSQFHIKALSSLAKILKNEEFRRCISVRSAKTELIQTIKRIMKTESGVSGN